MLSSESKEMLLPPQAGVNFHFAILINESAFNKTIHRRIRPIYSDVGLDEASPTLYCKNVVAVALLRGT
jgi:hypothetical protein